MRAYNLSPLFRSTVGFDRFDEVFDSVFGAAPNPTGYPPYNIEKGADDTYRIVMAVAGFKDEEIDVTVENGTLTVQGKTEKVEQSTEAQPQVVFLHRGIAARNFERRFALADYIQVAGAKLENGLLTIDLVREVPEAAKPRRIAIGKTA